MAFECELSERRSQPAVAIRTRTSQQDLRSIVGPTFARLATYIVRCGENPDGPPYVAYFNMDMQDLDIEIGFPVTKALPALGDIQPTQVPSGPCASLIYKGAYSGIGAAYNSLTEFVKTQKRNVIEPVYELYLNDPSETPPEELLTQVIFFLEPA